MGMNKYWAANNANKWAGANAKKEQTLIVRLAAHGVEPVETYPLIVSIAWYEKNKRRDPDNIVSAKKFILDGLQEAGVIENDGWAQIAEFREAWHVDKDNPRIEVRLERKLK